jgi:hypothetical protein
MLGRSSHLANVTPKVASWPLVTTLVALACLLQAMFTLPLAVRMAAETPCGAQIGGAMSHMDHRAMSRMDHHAMSRKDHHAMSHTDHQRPATPQLPHPHDQCPICHGSPVSFGTLTTALILLITVFIAPLAERANCNSLPHSHPGSRFATYRSRAPPASA